MLAVCVGLLSCNYGALNGSSGDLSYKLVALLIKLI